MTGFVRLHALLVDEDTLAQLCRDLPETACRAQPHNHAVHVASLSLTRVGEGLADPKLVLAWLLDAIGTPTWALGLQVPVRESLAMLPQLAISAHIVDCPFARPSTYSVVSSKVQQSSALP